MLIPSDPDWGLNRSNGLLVLYLEANSDGSSTKALEIIMVFLNDMPMTFASDDGSILQLPDSDIARQANIPLYESI